MSFHHVAFTVNNLEESIEWYQNILGFETLKKYQQNDIRIALLQRNDLRIELINFGSATQKLPHYRQELMSDLHVVGTKHICLQVDNLEKEINKLRKKGIKIATEKDNTFFGGNYSFIKDCNGILIELYEK